MSLRRAGADELLDRLAGELDQVEPGCLGDEAGAFLPVDAHVGRLDVGADETAVRAGG